MNRIHLLNLLYRRQKTVTLATESVKFIEALNRPVRYAAGIPTEVDGDAIAILRKAGA